MDAIGHRSPCGLLDARKGIGIRHQYYIKLINADARGGITRPARASVSGSVSILMNAEALAGFAPKGPQGLLEFSS